MDTKDLGKRCQNYLETILDGTNIENVNIVVWSDKRQVQVSDIDVFNEIAKKNHLDKIDTNNSGAFCYQVIYIVDNKEDYFTVSLNSRLKDDFLNKYRGNYILN